MNPVIASFPESEYISFAGDRVKTLGVLLSGTVHMIKENAQGEKSIISCLNRGSIICGNVFGADYSSLDVSYIVASDSKVLMLSVDKLQKTAVSEGVLCKLLYNIMVMMADNNSRLLEKMDIMSQKFIRDKIIAYLRMEALRQNSSKIHIPFNRTELADYLNVDRCSLTRELYQMKKTRIVRL